MALRNSAHVAWKRCVGRVAAALAAIAFVAGLLALWPMSGTAEPVVGLGKRYNFGCPSLVVTVGSPPRGLVAFERTDLKGGQLPAADATARAASVYRDQCNRARESRIGFGIVTAIVAVVLLGIWAVWRAFQRVVFER